MTFVAYQKDVLGKLIKTQQLKTPRETTSVTNVYIHTSTTLCQLLPLTMLPAVSKLIRGLNARNSALPHRHLSKDDILPVH